MDLTNLTDEQLDAIINSGPSKVGSFFRGMGQGASLGFLDEIAGGLDKLISGDDLAQTVARSRNKAASQANPGTYLAGELAGGLTTPAPTLKGANTLARMALTGGALGGVAGAGYSEATDATGRGLDALVGLGTGAIAGPLIGKTVGAVTNTAGRAANAVNDVVASARKTPNIVARVQVKSGVDPAQATEAIDKLATQAGEMYRQNAITKGLSKEQAEIAALATERNVRLSLGDITQSPKFQGLEEQARTNMLGEAAANLTKTFRNEQQGDLLRNIAKTAGTKLSQNSEEVGQSISQGIKREASLQKKGAQDAYGSYAGKSVYAPISAFKQLPGALRKELAKTKVIDDMPAVQRELSRMNRLVEVLNKRGVRGVGVDKDLRRLNLSGVERVDQRLTNAIGSVSDPAERDALRTMQGAFRDFWSDTVEQKLLTGDEKIIEDVAKAPQLWKQYKRTFWGGEKGDPGYIEKTIGKIVDLDLDPKGVVNLTFGAGKLGAKEGTAQVMGRMRNILGPDSPEFAQIKQEAVARLIGEPLANLSQGKLKGNIGNKFFDNVKDLVDNNRQLADAIFTKDELKALYADAKLASRIATKEPGVVSYSQTAPALFNMLKGVGRIMATPLTSGPIATGVSAVASPVIDKTKELALRKSYSGQLPNLPTFAKTLGQKAGLAEGVQLGGQAADLINLGGKAPLGQPKPMEEMSDEELDAIINGATK